MAQAPYFKAGITPGTIEFDRAHTLPSPRWVTLSLATQEWRWMFYREKYTDYGPISQVSLWTD